ncbi:MAG: hypothetical protein WDO12_03730 [Pseudomonadota bacterium]
MINPVKRLPLFLRVALLGVLALSVLARPMYSNWCETHQLGHALAALGHEKFRPDSRAELQLDAEHARGGHGALHSDDGGAYAGLPAMTVVPVVYFESMLNPLAVELPVLVQRPDKPFRPPIA